MRAIRSTILIALIAALAGGGYFLLSKPPAEAAKERGDEGSHGEKVAVMNDAKLAASGIQLDKVGGVSLKQTVSLNGVLQANQEQVAQVTPRFPGVVREVYKRIGDAVEKNDVLAKVESNQSLTTYELLAPLKGVIIERGAALGEYVSEQKPAFTVADLTTVWADFSIHRRDLRRVNAGDAILVDPDDGGEPLEAKVTYLSPVGASDTQSGLARAVVPNVTARLRPGLFVSGKLLLAQQFVPIAVKLSAIQTIDNRNVVFVRNGEKFEPREVELGQRDQEHAEVLFGLDEGDVYATKNSFVIKAEIAKASAAHEH